jgi:Domain of unknown function (DUF4276)
MTTILPIVEGDGDARAVPELIRRVAFDSGHYDVSVLPAHRRGDLPSVRKRFDDFLATAMLEQSPILWVLDYDCEGADDVMRDLADLRRRVATTHATQPVEFAFFVKEFESLFLADHETTRAVFPDIPESADWPENPEDIRNAKGWISKRRPTGRAYKETVHQVTIASQLNLDRLRDRSPSFVRFEAALLALLRGTTQH